MKAAWSRNGKEREDALDERVSEEQKESSY